MTSLKLKLCILILLVAHFSYAQKHSLTKIWETDSTFKVPESVLYSPKDNMLYVSNIDGNSNEKDLQGSITKMSLDGKTITHNWAINLSAPKGMGMYNNKLYVADIDEVAVIDVTTSIIIERIPVAGAVFLNDIAIDKKGVVYVSDSRTGKVHQIKNKIVTTYIENKMNVNGLLTENDDLYLAVKDTLFKSDKNKNLRVITTGMDQSSDGIVQINNKDFIVSCWNGIIYYINKDGSKEVLLDTRPLKINTADIGFNPISNIIYVPTFFKNKIVAYHLN